MSKDITRICHRCMQDFLISKRSRRKTCDDCKYEQAEAWELNRFRATIIFVSQETLIKAVDSGAAVRRYRNGVRMFRPLDRLVRLI
jgi:hypothetical protein